MPPPPHSRPENVLKRAQELIGVGQQQAALALLHEHVSSKRTRNVPIASLEPVMLLFVDLCVELRKPKLAKDGLYQYKNTAQNTNVGTIELVFRKLIELAEGKVAEAQKKADQVQTDQTQTTSGENVEDLEASETPESILLSTISGEQSRDRTDRAIVTPWLKFLWEVYRMVLDIFKNNARLEIMYQTTAHQAFAFCSKYARKTEFRRLCELLRNHLQNAAKFSSQMHAINLSDPDTLQRHLDTRFQQLNVAVELELWQEAFRSVEDIHTLLSLSKRPAKPIMMANYFEKLTRIFLVSENYLFHAAAWSRYYNLMRSSSAAVTAGATQKKDHPPVTEADMTKAASFVLLSALSIPVISTSRSRGALVDADEARKNKNNRLTNLLGMNTAPTRALLFKDALSKGLLKRCRPEIRELYEILEVEFHPLSICKRISPILSKIGADADLQKYVLPLQQVILTRLFQQLSQVYESVELKFVLGLAQFPEPYGVSSATIEKFIMNGCKKGDLAIRMDHASGVLTFDSDVFSSAKALHPGSASGSAEAETGSVQRLQSTPAEIARSQLTRLAKALFTVCQYVDPTFNEDRLKEKQAALQRAEAGAEKEQLETLARRDIIDRKKQAASTALAQKEKDLATQKRIKAQEAQAAETQRLQEEQRERDRKRLEAEKLRVQQEEAQRALEELKRGTKGIDLDELDISGLDSAGIRAIKIRALEKEKNELGEKLRQTARRIDHLERAYRMEEVKHLAEDYAKQREADLAAYEKAKEVTLSEHKQKHTDDVAIKHRLSRLLSSYESFKSSVQEQRKSEFEKRERKAQAELQSKMEQRRKEYRERKIREKREREAEEQRIREEEERAEREAEEKARADEERRAKMAEEKEKREAERRRLDEQAAKQRAREAEIEARLEAQKANRGSAVPSRPSAPTPASATTEGSTERPSGPPKLNLQGRTGAGPSWREREAARGAAGATDSADASPAPAAAPERTGEEPKRGGYVPPARRAAEGGSAPGGGWREREGSGRGPPGPPPPRGASSAAGPTDRPERQSNSRFPPRSAADDRVGARNDQLGDGSAPGRPSAAAAGAGIDRSDSPASTGKGYVPPHMRAGADRSREGASVADGTSSTVADGSAPLPRGQASTDGKYRPGAFRRGGAGGT